MQTARILYNGRVAATADLVLSGPTLHCSACSVADREAFERLLAQEQCTVLCGAAAYHCCTVLDYRAGEGLLTLMPDVE